MILVWILSLLRRKAQKASAPVVSKRLPNATDHAVLPLVYSKRRRSFSWHESKRESIESRLSTESLEVVRVGSKPEPVKQVKQDDVSEVDVYTPQQPKNGDHANAKKGNRLACKILQYDSFFFVKSVFKNKLKIGMKQVQT